MTRVEYYEKDLGEREYYYESHSLEELIVLPVTNDGFEALLERGASIHQLPVDDKLRGVFAGYIHHIGNHICETTLEVVGKVLRKSVANDVSWEIDQAIKKKNQDIINSLIAQNELANLEAAKAKLELVPEA